MTTDFSIILGPSSYEINAKLRVDQQSYLIDHCTGIYRY